MGDSSFLFANPSFFEGAARVLDIGGTLTEFNRSLTSEQADQIALAMDWQMIGQDFRDVTRKVLERPKEQGSQE